MILNANPNAQFISYQDEIESAILRVIRGNRYILGQEVEALEKEFAKFIGAKFSIGVANGTDALEIGLRSLGVGPGDEVITVSHTAVATVSAIESSGASPVLVDIEPNFYSLNPDLLHAAYTKKTKAVVLVHLYGQSGDITVVSNFCKKNNLFFVEDASQAHGAKYKGKYVGSFGHVGCFSCYPTKNLGAIGDAGLITTNEFEIKNKIFMLRQYGWKEKYISKISGRNSRLDEIQAAILRVKLKYLNISNGKRKKIAEIYLSNIKNQYLSLPQIRKGSDHVFHLFVVRTKFREQLINYLESYCIQTAIHYPVPVHLQDAYINKLSISQSMISTEEASNEVISLPIYPELPLEQVFKIVDLINAFTPQP